MKKLVLSHHAVFGESGLADVDIVLYGLCADCRQTSNGCTSSSKTPRDTAAATCRQLDGTPALNAECITRRRSAGRQAGVSKG
jgi:hypothetical protein